MRLNSNPKPKIGTTRTKSKFLILPKKINDQWRWLEKSTWVEKFTYNSYDRKVWISDRWINEQV